VRGVQVKSLWSISYGLHTRYKVHNNTMRTVIGEQSDNTAPSSDRPLKLRGVKLESLVIVLKNVTVNIILNFAHTAHHIRRVGVLGRRATGSVSFLRRLVVW